MISAAPLFVLRINDAVPLQPEDLADSAIVSLIVVRRLLMASLLNFHALPPPNEHPSLFHEYFKLCKGNHLSFGVLSSGEERLLSSAHTTASNHVE